jgi:hypothetical protein
VVTTETYVFLYTHGKHNEESHFAETTARQQSRTRLTIQQKAAVEPVILSHPMASSSGVRRSLNLSDSTRRDHIYISPSKSRHIWRKSGKVRDEVLSNFEEHAWWAHRQNGRQSYVNV